MEYDEIFTQIAGRAGSLDKILDAFFGFLNRRTDLYVTFNKEQKNARMGFPEGIAEEMVLKSMRKFPYRSLDDISSTDRSSNSDSNGDSKLKGSKIEKEKDNCKSNQASASPPSPSSTSKSNKNDRNMTVFNASNDKSSLNNNSSNSSNHSNNNCSDSTSRSICDMIKYTDDGKQIPIGNGGVTEKYHWTQTLNEVSIHIVVPFGTRSKEVSCIVKSSSLLLKVNHEVILQGSFEREVFPDESVWTLDTSTLPSNSSGSSETCVVLNLEKRTETWWRSILKGEPEIDTTKVDSTRKINEYDEETQASIRKIMYEQQQKRLGLMSQESDEDKAALMLEKAKLAPGSPFL